MGFWDTISKHKNIVYGASIAIAFGVSLLLLKNEKDEEEDIEEKIDQQEQDQGMQLNNQQKNSNKEQTAQTQLNEQQDDELTEQDYKETLELKKQLMELVPIEMDSQYISDKTIKNVYTRAIQLCLQKLISVHDQLIKLRIDNFNNMKLYAYYTVQLFNSYFELLNTALRTVIILLEIDENLFDLSRQYQEKQQKLRPAYIRDLAWHFMAEVRSEHQLTRDSYANYLKFQIEQIKIQYEELKNDLKDQNLMTKKLLVNARVDDITLKQLNISDYDSIRYQREYMKDEECAKLLKERNEALDIIIQ